MATLNLENNNTLSIFGDGNLIGSIPLGDDLTAFDHDTTGVSLGIDITEQQGQGGTWDGELKNFRIFNKVLEPSEISDRNTAATSSGGEDNYYELKMSQDVFQNAEHHYIVSFDINKRTFSIYIDGNLQGELIIPEVVTNEIILKQLAVMVGSDPFQQNAQNQIDGKMTLRSLYVYDRILDTEEVKFRYDNKDSKDHVSLHTDASLDSDLFLLRTSIGEFQTNINYDAFFLQTNRNVRTPFKIETFLLKTANPLAFIPSQNTHIDILETSRRNRGEIVHNTVDDSKFTKMTLKTILLPNLPLEFGTRITELSHFFVTINNVSSSSEGNIISNDKVSDKQTFSVKMPQACSSSSGGGGCGYAAAISRGGGEGRFIKIDTNQTIETTFNLYDDFTIQINTPDGTPLTSIKKDTVTPFPPLKEIQTHITFILKR